MSVEEVKKYIKSQVTEPKDPINANLLKTLNEKTNPSQEMFMVKSKVTKKYALTLRFR